MDKIYVNRDGKGYVSVQVMNESGIPMGVTNHLNGIGWTNIQVNGDTFIATNNLGYTYLFDKCANQIRNL